MAAMCSRSRLTASPLLPRAARFFRIEFVRRAFLVGGLSAFAGDGALCGFIHGGKAALDVPLGLSFAVLTI
jgi:hypothetical protein